MARAFEVAWAEHEDVELKPANEPMRPPEPPAVGAVVPRASEDEEGEEEEKEVPDHGDDEWRAARAA